jgi:hypothetical protein
MCSDAVVEFGERLGTRLDEFGTRMHADFTDTHTEFDALNDILNQVIAILTSQL